MSPIAALLLLASPVGATGPVEVLREKVVEAIRNCPKGEGDEIVVCSPDRGIAEGYRIPRLDPRYAQTEKVEREGAIGVQAARGAGTCSTVGSAGATGCTLGRANDWRAWKKQQKRDGERRFPW